ncbi:MAG: hypothetical protein ACPHY8_03185 [Patescibacteria group bacterium]
MIFLKSNTGEIFKGISLLRNFIISAKFSTAITSISGIIEASKAFSFGTNILLNHFSFAQIVAGKTHQTFLKFPSKDNSHKNKESQIYVSSIKS